MMMSVAALAMVIVSICWWAYVSECCV